MRQVSINHDREDHETRLHQLERRYRHIQDALTSATASYEALRESAGGSERQLERTRVHVQSLQRQLSQVLESLERAEELLEQDAMA
jgi:chromosome segregation ATPase